MALKNEDLINNFLKTTKYFYKKKENYNQKVNTGVFMTIENLIWKT